MRKMIIVAILANIISMGFSQGVEFTNPSIKIEADNSPSDVKYYIASDNGQYRLQENYLGFDNTPEGSLAGTITLHPETKYQKIDGFGFAITGSTAYNLLKMSASDRKALLTQVFSPNHGYGCNYVRIPIGCSDFSLSNYTCCDKEGIENFALTNEETDYIIPVMREILKINPDVKVISAPWTAPLWMKTNKEWTSGYLYDTYYDDYALYFVKWIKAMEANGIKIYGVTPQNEPLNHGNSASMYMGWEQQRNFIKAALGPKLKAETSTKLYVYDHNYNYDDISNEQHFPTQIYKDAEASQYIAGAAYHNYGGNASEMTYVHNQNPDKELIFTEWTAGTWSWPGVGMEAITTDARALIFDVVKNWGQGSVVWNLLLDSDRGPYRPGGCSTGNGAVDVSKSDYRQLTFNSFYYVICAAAAAVDQNSTYIAASGTPSEISSVAFENSDGFSVILMNNSDQLKNIKVVEGNHSFTAALPPKSLATYRW